MLAHRKILRLANHPVQVGLLTGFACCPDPPFARSGELRTGRRKQRRLVFAEGYDDPMGAAAAPRFSAAAPVFAEIGYNFVAQAPPFTTFGAGAQKRATRFWLAYCTASSFHSPAAKFFFRLVSFVHGQPLRHLRSGEFSEQEERQALSIAAQFRELEEAAAKEQLQIVASFEEARTARETGRTVFGEMLGLIVKGE